MRNSSPERWEQLDSLVDRALARPEDERSAFLRVSCGHDAELYARTLELMDHLVEAESVLGESALEFAPTGPGDFEYDDGDQSGLEIGAYRLLREIGRGGMGAVYLAERADGAFTKQVALKLVKRGLDTDEVLSRFNRERRIQAGLDHPGIARLIDAGAAADGKPYLVMEYVEGESLTAFADRFQLGINERLDLFVQTCEAVRHAHRRLIIHRDLKPSNILVARDDEGRAHVKLLDFGIARLLGSDEDDLVTGLGSRILTPAYAAPEQLRGDAPTTAFDVYSLGVVLYELLAGQRPGVPALPPSAVRGEAASKNRSMTPEALTRRLAGDLDTIAATALAEDVADRYPSIDALLDDLRNHKASLPIKARPASAFYRGRKFVGRNRRALGVGALVTALLVGGAGAALWQAGLAADERDRAKVSAHEAERAAAFLESLFSDTDPTDTVGDSLSAVDLLDRGRMRIDHEFADTPLVKARMLRVMGDAYRELMDAETGRDLLKQALAIQVRELGANDHETLETQNVLGSVMYFTGEFDAARAVYDDWLSRVSALPNDGSLSYARLLALQGELLYTRSKHEEAEPILRNALTLFHKNGTDNGDRVTTARDALSAILFNKQEYAEAAQLQREIVMVARDGGSLRMQADALGQLATIYHEMGIVDKSNVACEQSMSIHKRLNDSSDNYMNILMACGGLRLEQGNFDKAEELLQRAELMLQGESDGEPILRFRIAIGQARVLFARGADATAERRLTNSYQRLVAARGLADPMVERLRAEAVEMCEREGHSEVAARLPSASTGGG